MQIRMEISDKLYIRYKDLADKSGFAVTKLNQIIFEKALQNWIIETEKKCFQECDICGAYSDKFFHIFSYNTDFMERNQTVCEKCYNDKYKIDSDDNEE